MQDVSNFPSNLYLICKSSSAKLSGCKLQYRVRGPDMESVQVQSIVCAPGNGDFTAVKPTRHKLTSMTSSELKEAMRQLGLTQEQLARTINVSTSAVSKWCQGKARISGPAAILLKKMAAEHRRKNRRKKEIG